MESYSAELTDITNRRQIREFIKAEELCKALLEKQPESSEANWQALLSSLGVVYVKEKETGASKPTFFSYTYDERTSVLENSYYKNAVRFATGDDRQYYEEKGKELDRLLKEFFELVAKEDSYDIFISFKQSEQVTTADGEVRTVETNDCVKAREIYEHLKDKYRVFFSPESIGKDTGILGEKYEPRILKALQTAQAMILLGSKKEYLESQWVENEWKRYLYFMEKGKKNKASLIYIYNQSFAQLPPALQDMQLPSVDMFKADMFKQIDSKLTFVKSSKG
ncbi:MAG: toll/interleukin-1 receptor domain-containing protein, partial [Eubacteriales bacterium]